MKIAALPAGPAIAALALAFGAALLPAMAADASFRCAALLPSASRQPAYARAGTESRCEGFFDQTVSQPFVELLSLTRHHPDAEAPASSALQIRSMPGVAAQLAIQPVRPSPFYRVDAELPAGAALTWNAAPMLATTGLRLADLGFLARASAAEPDTLAVAPVVLPPTAVDATSAYAVLRVSVPVTSMAARRYRLGAADAPAGAWRELPGTPLYAWDTIVLPIEIAAAGGDVNVDVRAVGKDGRPLPLLRFVVLAR